MSNGVFYIPLLRLFAIQCVFPTSSTSGLALFLMPSRGGTCDSWLPSGWCHSRLPARCSAGLRRTSPAAAPAHQPPVGLARLSPLKLFLLPGTPSAISAQVSLSAVPSDGLPWLQCYPLHGIEPVAWNGVFGYCLYPCSTAIYLRAGVSYVYRELPL